MRPVKTSVAASVLAVLTTSTAAMAQSYYDDQACRQYANQQVAVIQGQANTREADRPDTAARWSAGCIPAGSSQWRCSTGAAHSPGMGRKPARRRTVAAGVCGRPCTGNNRR